jgi:hypothetical protein
MKMNLTRIKLLAIDEPGGNRNLKININAQHKICKRETLAYGSFTYFMLALLHILC